MNKRIARLSEEEFTFSHTQPGNRERLVSFFSGYKKNKNDKLSTL